MKTKRKILLAVLLLLIISSFLGLWVKSNWERKQAAIHITPETAIQMFQDAGYIISDVQERLTYPGPMAIPLYALEFNLQENGTTYYVLLALYDDWETAQLSADFVNALDDRMSGGYAYAISYGTLLAQIDPSDKNLGRNLLSILKTIE